MGLRVVVFLFFFFGGGVAFLGLLISFCSPNVNRLVSGGARPEAAGPREAAEHPGPPGAGFTGTTGTTGWAACRCETTTWVWLEDHVAMVQNQWCHFGVGAPPILEPILVGIGMSHNQNPGR